MSTIVRFADLTSKFPFLYFYFIDWPERIHFSSCGRCEWPSKCSQYVDCSWGESDHLGQCNRAKSTSYFFLIFFFQDGNTATKLAERVAAGGKTGEHHQAAIHLKTAATQTTMQIVDYHFAVSVFYFLLLIHQWFFHVSRHHCQSPKLQSHNQLKRSRCHRQQSVRFVLASLLKMPLNLDFFGSKTQSDEKSLAFFAAAKTKQIAKMRELFAAGGVDVNYQQVFT